MNSSYAMKLGNGCGWPGLAALFIGLACTFGPASPSHAQALGWEGETGVFVTPLAYTASSETQRFHPVLAYHFLSAGPVIGDFHETSLELGIGKRMEIGYTHEFHTFGNDANLSYLWQSGFDIFNGKVILIPENSFKAKWVPALSLGTIARVGVRNVGDYQAVGAVGRATSGGHVNASVYLVATKVVPTKLIPIVLSAGVRGTDAELWGMGGSAPDWEARAFGAVAFVFKLPAKSTLTIASEASQQPHHPYGFDGQNGTTPLNIPTTLTYAARFVPSTKYKLNFDLGVAQIAGQVYGSGPTGVNLQARHQVGVQVSYGF
jgi:hypothetical protein